MSPRKGQDAPRPDSFLEKFTYTDTAEGTVEGILLGATNSDDHAPSSNSRYEFSKLHSCVTTSEY